MSYLTHRGPEHVVSDRALPGAVFKAVAMFFALIVFVILLHPVTARAATLVIPYLSAAPGTVVKIPIKIDQIENLAGIKLVLSYNKTALTYVKAVKAAAASSLMHVVNHKKPGRLIIVMAGARGIKGKDVTLMTLCFTVNPDLPESIKKIKIAVKEIQVMDDRLKEVQCTIKSGGVAIVRPQKSVKLHGGKK